jgi:hypothetical protein
MLVYYTSASKRYADHDHHCDQHGIDQLREHGFQYPGP